MGLNKPLKVFPSGGNDNVLHVMISALCTSVLQAALETCEQQWAKKLRALELSMMKRLEDEEISELHSQIAKLTQQCSSLRTEVE